MTSYLRITLFFLLIVFSISITKAQKFSVLQQQMLQEKATELLQSYNDLMQNVSKKEIEDSEKTEQMNTWFGISDFKLYNRIAPDLNSEHISIEEYVNVIRNDYPAGIVIKVEPDNIEEIKPGIIEVGEEQLYVAIPVRSSIMGIYKGKKIVKNKKNFLLIYSFSTDGKTNLSDFKFEGFRLESNLKPLTDYSFAAIDVFFGMGINICDLDYSSGYEAENGKSRQFGFSYHKSYSKNFAINIGLSFNKYTVSYKWKNPEATNTYFINGSEGGYESGPSSMSPHDYSGQVYQYVGDYTDFHKDQDGDYILPYVFSNGINDEREVKTLAIPFSFEFKSGKPDKYSIYFQVGAQILYKYSSAISAKGEITVEGYLPEYDFTLRDLPDYGLGTDMIDAKYTLNNKKLTIAPLLAFGTRIYLSKGLGLNFQFQTSMPLGNILNEKGNSGIHKYAPEYSKNEFFNDQLKVQQKQDESDSWISYGSSTARTFWYNLAINIGLFYKF